MKNRRPSLFLEPLEDRTLLDGFISGSFWANVRLSLAAGAPALAAVLEQHLSHEGGWRLEAFELKSQLLPSGFAALGFRLGMLGSVLGILPTLEENSAPAHSPKSDWGEKSVSPPATGLKNAFQGEGVPVGSERSLAFPWTPGHLLRQDSAADGFGWLEPSAGVPEVFPFRIPWLGGSLAVPVASRAFPVGSPIPLPADGARQGTGVGELALSIPRTHRLFSDSGQPGLLPPRTDLVPLADGSLTITPAYLVGTPSLKVADSAAPSKTEPGLTDFILGLHAPRRAGGDLSLFSQPLLTHDLPGGPEKAPPSLPDGPDRSLKE